MPKKIVPQFSEEFSSKVRQAFQNTAEAIGGDVLQACRDMGEREVIDREACYDFLETYGGTHGREVQKWVYDYPGGIEDLEAALNSMRVPKDWA